MDKRDQLVFVQHLTKLALAIGEDLTDARMDISFQDLAEFPLPQVLEAMTWARKNLTHFPKIAELRRQIEGDPEAHADRAWQELIVLVQVGAKHALLIHDRCMTKAMQVLWRDWPHAQDQVGQAEGPYEQGEYKKMFKRAYLEAWKSRDNLPGDVHFKGTEALDLDRGRLRFPMSGPAKLRTYAVVDNRAVVVETREVPNPNDQLPPMTPEEQARVQEVLAKIGSYGQAAKADTPLVLDVTGDHSDVGRLAAGKWPNPLRVMPEAGEPPSGAGDAVY